MNHAIAQTLNSFGLDAYRPIVQRELNLGKPLSPRAGNLATVIMGMRRCGKTYRLFQEIDALLSSGVDPNRILYFTFEDDRLLPITPRTGDEVIQTHRELHPDAYEQGVYLFFDEIQEMQDWDRWLRRIIDTTRATIYVTGSSSSLLSEDIATALRGRSIAYELTPYSFREAIAAQQGTPPPLPRQLSTTQAARLTSLFKSYLRTGGFPAVQGMPDQQLVLVLQSYAQRAVAQDVLERHNLGNPQAISLLAQRLLAASGREFSLRKMEGVIRSLGISAGRNTLAQALDYLEDAFLVKTAREFSRAISQNPRSSSKVYAIDPGLAYANSPALTQDAGQRLETAVFNELCRRVPVRRAGAVSTYRTAQGHEVDFVVGDALSQQGFALYQVTERLDDPRTTQREMRALEEAMAEQGLGEGYLVVGEGERRDIDVEGGTIHQVPAWQWCLEQTS